MKKNLISAGLVAVGLLIWLISGLFVERSEPLVDTRTAVMTDVRESPFRVRVARFDAQQRPVTQTLRGRTASKRSAEVSAETAGRVVDRPIERGQRVQAGDLLCAVAVEDRKARVDEAKADLLRAELEYRGAVQLQDKGLLSEVRIAQVAADLESARAALARAELDLERTAIRAPFDGVIEALRVEVGELIAVGSPCVSLLDLDPLLVTANVSERDIGALSVGQAVQARSSNGDILEGTVSFVGRQSDAATRTYPLEITVPNPDYRLRAGLTTAVNVITGSVFAHRVPPSLFTLDDAGVLGLRGVDPSNRVVFYPVEVVDDAPEGVWVTGLPGLVRLITAGQEFVTAGEVVDVQMVDAPPVAVATP